MAPSARSSRRSGPTFRLTAKRARPGRVATMRDNGAVASDPSERGRAWALANGSRRGPIRLAHPGSNLRIGPLVPLRREDTEAIEDAAMTAGATRAVGAGRRPVQEAPDAWRTCFERDRDRIVHSTALRRAAGKTQVFIAPANDHLRTRLTHALEVAQVAVAMASSLRLNVALTQAIALAHDCGHGPFGHASEDAFSPYVPGGYDHAVWGADVTLADLNLCDETVDGVRNHSWSRPSPPRTPEGAVTSLADRVAYCCHDLDDALRSSLVHSRQVPAVVRELCGETRSQQIGTFIAAVVEAGAKTGRIGMMEAEAAALAELRAFLYERVYLRPESLAQREAVIPLLRNLVEHFAEGGLPPGVQPARGLVADPLAAAVRYVSGMTDRFALRLAVEHLGWDPRRIPLSAA